MEWHDILAELVQFVEQAAPTVWAIARRQVLVYAIQDVVLTLLFGVGAYLLGRFGTSALRKHQAYEREREKSTRYLPLKEYDIAAGGLYFFMALAIVLALVWAFGAIGRFINPDYYAIRLLVEWAH